jgi:hypothetical protein
MPPVQQNGAVKSSSSSVMSSFMCCTTERSGQVQQQRESRSYTRSSAVYRSESAGGQGRYLWLDPTRWVEKRTVKKEKVSDLTCKM